MGLCQWRVKLAGPGWVILNAGRSLLLVGSGSRMAARGRLILLSRLRRKRHKQVCTHSLFSFTTNAPVVRVFCATNLATPSFPFVNLVHVTMGSGSAQDLLRLAQAKNHFQKAEPQHAQLLQFQPSEPRTGSIYKNG